MTDLITLLIPFLFMLAIVFGALDVSGVFKNKRVNALIALVFAFFALTYQPAVDFIMGIMPIAIIFFIGFFFIGFVIKIAKKGADKDYTLLIIIITLILLILATQGSDAIAKFMPGFENQGNTILVAAGIAFIAVLLLAAYKLPGEKRPSK
jgi:hypothetical protein